MITLQAIRPFLFQSKSSNAPLKNNFNSSSALINFSVSEPDFVDIVTYDYMCGQLWPHAPCRNVRCQCPPLTVPMPGPAPGVRCGGPGLCHGPSANLASDSDDGRGRAWARCGHSAHCESSGPTPATTSRICRE